MSCPHYVHTDRSVGNVTTHVCRACATRIVDCEHLAPAPAPAPAPRRAPTKRK